MSQSKEAVQLCALLVDETYGELASRIFTILLRRGRLPIHSLAQHTRLARRQLQHGLVVLIQQNLIYYYEDGSQTFYEANQGAAYGLIRSGKILEIVETRYGARARGVMQKLLLLGHAKVGDLADSYQLREGTPEPPTNGTSTSIIQTDPQSCSPAQLDFILCELLEAGFVQTVTETAFRSPDDTYNEIEQAVIKSEFTGGTKGAKQKEMLKISMRNKLQEIRAKTENWKPKGNKRKPEDSAINGVNGNAKRRKISNGSLTLNGNHQEDENLRLERELVVRVNYEKCTVALRNLRLVNLANSRIGETTSQIYGELLRLLEDRIPRCRPDPRIDSPDIDERSDGPTITTMELAAGMSKYIDIGTGIGKTPGDKVNTKTILKTQKSTRQSHGESEAEVDGEASPDEDDSDDGAQQTTGNGNGNVHEMDYGSDHAGSPENGARTAPKRTKVTFQDSLPRPPEPEDRSNSTAQLKNHLLLLAADECRFLRRCGTRGQGEWTVDFDRLVNFLQQLELDSIILENFGTAGHRLARMMRSIGKMDEKLLSTMALMKQKDVRTKLAEMQMAGMADIQEVPKDATRANNRTIFLWYFDSERITSVILRNIHKAIARCFQRLEVEKRRASGILSLTERSDVKDNTEDALTGEQLNMLRQIRSKEDKLLGQISRLDELIATYRDF